MNKLSKYIVPAAWLFILVAEAHAQWTIAFQDRTKRDLNGVFFLDQNRGWIIGDGGIIHASQDSGLQWSPLNARVNTNLNDVFFRNPNEGWLIASGALIMRTQDAG